MVFGCDKMGEMAHLVAPFVKLSSANLVSMVVDMVLVLVLALVTAIVFVELLLPNSKDFIDPEDIELDVVLVL